MAKGRGFGALRKGARIIRTADLAIGEMLLEYSAQFDAENTIRITHQWEDRVWARFVDAKTSNVSMGQDFCIWGFEIESGAIELWRPIRPAKPKKYEAKRHATSLPLFEFLAARPSASAAVGA